STPHNWERTTRFGLIGLCLHGPYFLYGFRMLDERFGPAKTLVTAAKKTALGQLTLFPVYLVAFFTAITLMECRGVEAEAVAAKLRSSFMPAYAAGSVFWPIANMVNFM
ncbi:PXMP2/4 family protein 4, partial [Tetrabaena socialis]